MISVIKTELCSCTQQVYRPATVPMTIAALPGWHKSDVSQMRRESLLGRVTQFRQALWSPLSLHKQDGMRALTQINL